MLPYAIGEERGEVEGASYSGGRSKEALQAFVQANLVSGTHGEEELQRGRAGQRASERERGSGSTSATRGAGMCICMYVYIYRERERKREREGAEEYQ